MRRKKSILNVNPLLLLGIPLVISLLTIAIGFSALSTTLTINGSASFVPVGMIRITLFEQNNLVKSNENSKSFTSDT